MADPADDFAALVARARDGDAGALAELIRRYEPDLRLAARVRLGPALRPILDSMDLVQSVNRSLIRGLRQDQYDISSPEQLFALAVSLVRHKIARHWRRRQRELRLNGTAAEPGELAERLLSLSSSVDDPARAAEQQDQIRHLCSTLAPLDRQLIELRLQGYGPAEIAERLGLKDGALRVRLCRLRERLRASGVLEEW